MPLPVLSTPCDAGASTETRHDGFRALSVLLPGDDPAEFLDLLDELTAHFDPQGLTDRRYVREMADAEWSLRRARLFQERYLSAKCAELQRQMSQADPIEIQYRAYDALLRESAFFARLAQFEARYRQQYDRAHRGWLGYQRHRRALIQANTRVAATLEVADRSNPEVREDLDRPSPRPVLTNEPNAPAPGNARNAPCPCGSGLKYKRCCGRHAPPLLIQSPRQAA